MYVGLVATPLFAEHGVLMLVLISHIMANMAGLLVMGLSCLLFYIFSLVVRIVTASMAKQPYPSLFCYLNASPIIVLSVLSLRYYLICKSHCFHLIVQWLLG
jgi:hypothetical protein